MNYQELDNFKSILIGLGIINKAIYFPDKMSESDKFLLNYYDQKCKEYQTKRK